MGKGKTNKKPQKGVGNNTMKNAINKAVKEDREKIIHGKVKWFDVKKGYGFIIGDDGQEYFCHHSGIINGKTYTGLENSDTVEFKIIPAEKGPQAVEITRIEEASNEESGSEDAEPVSEETTGGTENDSVPGDVSGEEVLGDETEPSEEPVDDTNESESDSQSEVN